MSAARSERMTQVEKSVAELQQSMGVLKRSMGELTPRVETLENEQLYLRWDMAPSSLYLVVL